MDGLKKLWVLHLFFSESSFGKNAFHNSTYIASLVMYSGTCIELRIFHLHVQIFSFVEFISYVLDFFHHLSKPFPNEMRFMLDKMTEWDAIFQKSDQKSPKNMKKIVPQTKKFDALTLRHYVHHHYTFSPSRIGDCVCFKASSSIKVQKWENLVRKWLWQTLLTWLKASPQGIWGELPLIFNPNLKLTKVRVLGK